MPNGDMDKQQLIRELEALRQRVAELEDIEAEYLDMGAALDEAGKQHQNLFELAGDSVFIVDPSDFRILNANENSARRLGYEREELLQLSLPDIEVPADEGPQNQVAWTSKFSRTKFYEAKHRRKDGTEMPVEVSSRLVRREGRAVLLNFVRDLSIRKQLEAERERLIVELDAYAHSVAHDLKSPIAVIRGYSDMLMDTATPPTDDEVLEWADVIHRTSYKMQTIIDELLLLASVRKLDHIDVDALNMSHVVSEALTHLANRIPDSGAQVSAPDEWPPALGYAPWVEEVWANYISNAIKYGGEPPIIELGATPEDDGMVRFWVRDNGAGIAPEDRTKLFNQFTRLDEARAEGHGLGLSIVQRIVEKLGGEVGVESQMGEGSVFSFTLPASQ